MTFFLTPLKFPFSRKKHAKKQTQLDLLYALDDAERTRAEAQQYFDAVSDDALIVSAIHELESANAKYSALLRQARETGVSRTFWEAEAMRAAEKEGQGKTDAPYPWR